jgi:hypothetical protein
MLIDPDVRLAAAAGGAARYLADAAGLDNGAVSALQTETVAACSKSLQQLAERNQRVEVTVTRSPDRIEVVVNRPGAEASRLTKYLGASAS